MQASWEQRLQEARAEWEQQALTGYGTHGGLEVLQEVGDAGWSVDLWAMIVMAGRRVLCRCSGVFLCGVVWRVVSCRVSCKPWCGVGGGAV